MSTDYTTYITPQHRERPKFTATVEVLAGALGGISDTLLSLPSKFDVDTAEGAQLDVVGAWVGLGRSLTAPVPNTWFSFDTPGKGWDEGYWKDSFTPAEGVVYLDDLSYRAALRLKVSASHWTGQLEKYMVFPVRLERSEPNILLMKDNQDMSFNAYVLGAAPSEFLQIVIQQENLIPKPFAVRINSYTFTNEPVFGVDYATLMINGPDYGHFLT